MNGVHGIAKNGALPTDRVAKYDASTVLTIKLRHYQNSSRWCRFDPKVVEPLTGRECRVVVQTATAELSLSESAWVA